MTTPTPPRDVLDDIEQRIQESAPLLDRLKECHARIGRMCAERRGPRMSIPAEWHDDDMFICTTIEEAYDRIERALAVQGEVERPMKLLGYANPSRIRMTCASKPGGAHLGQVAIYAGESVDPMEIQERDNPTIMGEPDARPGCYSCGCRSDRPRNWMGRSICSKCQPDAARTQEKPK